MPVTVIVQEKGCDTKENIHRNFGMPMPEVSEGAAADEAGGKISPTGDLLCRHSGSFLWYWRKRTGGSHFGQPDGTGKLTVSVPYHNYR